MKIHEDMKIKKQGDLHYMDERHTALLLNGGKYTRAIIWIFLFFLLTLLVWIYYAKIDKMIRGTGRVVPSLELQYIQSYDGGIIREIFVHDGDAVHNGDRIVRIDDADFKSKYLGGEASINALTAKKFRLQAESKNIPFKIEKIKNAKLHQKLLSEKKLYDAKQTTLMQKIAIIEEKVVQKKLELVTIEVEMKNLKKALLLAKETLEISRKMLKHKVVSKMQYNEQLRLLNTIESDIETKKTLLPKITSEIKGSIQEVTHARLAFLSESREELEKVAAELEKLNEAKNIDKGRISRTVIQSPIHGVVKKMYYNTVGGVVKPGGVVAEVIPTEEHLIIDTKVEPSNIAFIYVGQKAVVRFSAYDFATYGSLMGKVISVSADTVMDEIDKRHYYTVKIKTKKNYLEQNGKQLPIKIGMVATVDIMNGKQSILDYIINPIIKAKQNMLSNH